MPTPAAVTSAFDVQSFISDYYDAWSGTDEERILSYFADNILFQMPGVLMEGKEAVRSQFVRPFLTAFPGNWHRVKNLVYGPDSAIVEFTFEAEHTGPFKGYPATGARVAAPGCGVYEYDAATRQITAARIYFDMGTLLRTITDFPVDDPSKAAEALQLNERNLSLIVNTIPIAAWTARPDGSCDFLNQRWLDYAGLTAEQATGWGWAETIHPEDRARAVEHWQSCLASGVPVETEARMRRFDGAYRWFLFRASPVRDDTGQIIRWCGTNIDIEDRKRVEDSLRASELSWRQIVDSIPGLVATTGAAGEVEFLNQQTLEYFGRTSEELKNWALIDAVHPDDLPRVIAARRLTIETGTIYDIEHRCRRADGVYRWFQVRGLPVRSVDGTITAWYLLLTDIEERKQAEEALQSNERNLSLVLNTIPTHIYVLNTEGSVQYVNQAVMDYTGLSLEDVKQEDYRDRVIHPEDFKRVRAGRAASLRRGAPFSTEQRVLGNDGRYRWFLVRYKPLLDEQGRIARWYVAAFDIEDRKRAEAELQKSEARLRQVIDAIPALAWCNLPDGPNEFLNKGWHDYTGLSPEESHGWGWQSAFHPDDLPPLMAKWIPMLASGLPDEIEARLRRHDGVYRWFLIRAQPFRDESGTIVRWYGTSTDIDDRKRAEEALRARELDARSLLDNMPGFLGRHSPDGSPEIVNRPFLQYHGKTVEEIGQWRTGDVVHPDDHAHVIKGLASGISGGQPWGLEFRLRRFDGIYRWFQARWVPVRDGEGRILHWNALTTDIDDRKQAEDALARHAGVRGDVSAAFSRPTHLAGILHGCAEAIVRHLGAAFARIWLLNKDESVLELQASAGIYTRLDGSYSRIPIGDLKVGLIAREKKAHFTNDVMNDPRVKDKGWAQSNGMVAFAGHPLVVEDRLIGVVALFARHALAGSVLDTLASVADTIAQGIERKRAERALTRARAELAHMARVTTLSALTTSIAHEVNQPISAVITSADACLRWLNREQPEIQRVREAAARIQEDGKRAAEIISHLKVFYRKDVSPQREPVQANDVVGEMLVLLRSEADRHAVDMRTELAADLPSVRADRVQLQQVLMNLMVNGMEAMHGRGGALTISTGREEGMVRVSVTDTGVGLPATEDDQIFNAFFTTKAGGTGMGLAISHTIIESHGGRIWAARNPEAGATFHFTLPTGAEA